MKKRRIRWASGSAALLLAAGGCDSFWSHIADDCERMVTCAHFLPSGEGGGTPSACLPSESGEPIDATCGVFANAAAAPGGDGTKAKPFASLQEALDKAVGGRVYACAAQGAAFAEAVTIAHGNAVYGGFDCDAWTWSATARSAIAGPADAVALTLTEKAAGAKVQGFAITAASATRQGGSSIGVAVADVEAELAQVEVTAGDAMDGENGATPMEAPQVGASGETGIASNACVAMNAVVAGTGGVTSCEDGETRGGVGGTGGITGTDNGNGQPGQDGAPAPEPNPDGYGLGGRGQNDPAGTCREGETGSPGSPGGAGAAGSGATLTLAGIGGGDGGQGIPGARGQGGGGGGGAKAGAFCSVGATLVDGVGASGGGGGAGGCGGKGGGGGKAGGSSVGILSLGTRLTLTEVAVAVGKGGKGGDGASSKTGARGGDGAAGGTDSGVGDSKPGCQGGNGGLGGRGGVGGGGRAGYAVGVAYASAPAATPGLKRFTPGTPGAGGSAGPGGPPESAGAPGGAGACWNVSANTACGQ